MIQAEFKFYSETLEMNTTISVIVPQKGIDCENAIQNKSGEDKLKCLYLLHGLGDDYSVWIRRTSIERYAQKYGICVVMPDGNRSFYTDMKHGGRYYTYITKELPEIIKTHFNISGKKEDNYIAGFSMGGYGALKIALKEDNYCAVAGLSSATDIFGMADKFNDDYMSIFGEEVNIPKKEDLFYLARERNNDKLKPRIFMAVGTEDFIYEDNMNLKEIFEGLSYDYTYMEEKGSHDWNFCDKYIQKALEWMFK